MNWKRIFVISIVSISMATGDLLTRQENQERMKECGKSMGAKVYDGRNTTRTEAPWTVHQRTPIASQKDKYRLCTATVISSRHILSAANCFTTMNANRTEFETILMTGKAISAEDCRGDDYVIDDEKLAEKVSFYSGLNETIKKDDEPVAIAKKIVLIGVCKKYEKPSETPDLAIIEIADDFNFTYFINQACISISMDDAAPFVLIDFYGYGSWPHKWSNDDRQLMPELLYEQTRIIQPHFVYRNPAASDGEPNGRFVTRSWNEHSVVCAGDTGGAALRKVRGRTTIVGVLSQSSCYASAHREPTGHELLRTKFAVEHFVPVPLYTGKICEHTGICSTASPTIQRMALIVTMMTGIIWISNDI